MKTHLELARDFREAGNEPMARYHMEKATEAYEKDLNARCGLFCTIIGDLLDWGSDHETVSYTSCRDPVTTPPSGPRRC